ncbi:MAG TPA: aspartate aminotransferase family protein [Bacteroidota bacterium]|nr:aspartate aminotransferase family protein [Bacteroidota bacterium]
MSQADKDARYFFTTYKRLPLEIDYGEGPYLYTKDGRKYLDLFAGIAVNALGHNCPAVIAAIESQMRRYIHVSNMFHQDTQIDLAELLLKTSGYDRIFFTNSGTEAMEGALKVARKWGKNRGKANIFGMSDSFHGRTMGALSITGRDKYREGFEPFLPNTGILRFNDVEDLVNAVNDKTLAVVLEFIQGEGGINLVSTEYIQMLSALKDRYRFLIIADEIQAGLGRTGKFFSFEHFGIVPDIVVIAKAVGGGLPLGAFLGTRTVADVLTSGTHGTTFGGNPVACAAGLATLRELLLNGVMENARTVGEYLKGELLEVQHSFPSIVKDVRGIGLMVGLELTIDGTAIIDKLREEGVLLNLTNNTVIRWVPPLNITRIEIDQATEALRNVLHSLRIEENKAITGTL